MIVSASERGGKLDHMESRLLDNVFDFADRVAREVMVPRQDMVCLYAEDSFEKNIQKVMATRHTRYPLCEEDKDHVLGVIHVRSLLNISDDEKATFDIRSRMNALTVVPESMEISKVLQTMQQKRVQLCVVADEYGGTAGLVTMEDLLEEIVGDIQDEHDEEKEEEVTSTTRRRKKKLCTAPTAPTNLPALCFWTIFRTFCILNLKNRKKILSVV